MSRTRRVTGPELIAALGVAGFRVARIRGSHHFLQHDDGRCTVVPVHNNETLGPGLTHRILRDCELTAADLVDLLREP
ncbi:MAG: type II toxin-antitoxin system HicA family toxin [Acidobacteriota bacterium]